MKISTTPGGKKDSESDSFFDQNSENRDEVDEAAFRMTQEEKLSKTKDNLKMTQSGSIIGGVSGDSLNNTGSMRGTMKDTMKDTITSKNTIGTSLDSKKKVKVE